MKKSWKLVLILAIAAVLLFSAGAYILVFQTNVTVDHYISRGASALENGRYSAAIRHYSSALKLDDSQPEIPIALADAYKGTGNFTKAEYTLVSAITKHPEKTALYVALSRTYVQQEKFLDADRMLSRAANETVKAELEAMRPSAPTLTPESGYYSDYITVSASCTAGRIFLTTTGEYPSGDDHLYAGPIQLPGGETTICALVVDDSGLVSPAVYAGYTIAGVIEPITISDPVMDSILREAIGKAPEDALMSNELWNIEELEISGSVTDLSQLSCLTGLKKLKISGIAATDFSILSALPGLTELDLSGCVLGSGSLDAVGSLTELTHLNLSGCALSSIQSLSKLSKLTKLDLSNNVVRDISALSNLKELTSLSLKNNPVTSLSALSGLSALQSLDVSSCELTGLEPLSGLTMLETLDVTDNAVTSITSLQNCKNLEKIHISSNAVTDISVLPGLSKLTYFDGSYNEIKAIPTFDAAHPLQYLNLNYNSVSSVKGLSGLGYLNYVLLDHSNVSDLTPLADCNNLVQVDVWDAPVTEAGIKALQGHSIIVNYNPN